VVDAKAGPALAQAVKKLSEQKSGWGNGIVVEFDSA